MPSMTEVAMVGKRQDIKDAIYNAESDRTPVFSLIRKGERPQGMLTTWVGEVYPSLGTVGVKDNTPATNPTSVPRYLVEAYCQHFRREWGVGYLATLTNAAGVARNEAGHQMSLAMILHRMMIEQRILGIDEMAIEAGEQGYEMRGMLLWLAAAAQTVKPVDEHLRPAAAQNLTTALASVTETTFKDALQSCFGEKKSDLDLLGLMGADLRGVVDDFTNVSKTAADTSHPRTIYTGRDARTYQNAVDFLTFSFGKAKLMTTPRLYTSESTGEATAYSPKSAAFIDPAMWEFCWLDKPANTNLAPDGSGKKGFVDGVGILKCLNPKGQFRLISNT